MQTCNMETEEFRQHLEQDLIYLCTFGLDDPLRKGVQASIAAIRYGHPDAALE